MTDSKKLNLLLEKVVGIENDIVDMKKDIAGIENDIVGMKTDLHRLHHDDNLILDEIERVHNILDKHKADKSAHTA